MSTNQKSFDIPKAKIASLDNAIAVALVSLGFLTLAVAVVQVF